MYWPTTLAVTSADEQIFLHTSLLAAAAALSLAKQTFKSCTYCADKPQDLELFIIARRCCKVR